MGTPDDAAGSVAKKRTLLGLLQELNWSRARLGREDYYACHDDDDEVELRRHVEKVRKHLQRDTTSAGLLDRYITLVTAHREYANLERTQPVNYSQGALDPRVESGLRKISKRLSAKIQGRDD